jgi:AraC-like DNA-binding protein
MEKTLPPYLRCYDRNDNRVVKAYFQHFNSHPLLPLALRRDFYENGENSGWFLHSDFLALYAVRGGRGIHWIDNQPYGLVRGDVYLMAPGATHRFCQFSDLEMDAFYFQVGMFQAEELAALREIPGIWRLFAGDTDVEHRIHLSPEQWRKIETQIEMMRQEWGETSRAGGLRLKHEFFHLLVALARLMQKPIQPPPTQDRERKPDSGLAEAIRYCEENFDKPLSVPKLAARTFLSTGHFRELFSREVGMPPAAYIRQIRLERARALLRDTNIPVAQIAAQCGFRDATQFSRAFHNYYENAPMRYRQQEKKTRGA